MMRMRASLLFHGYQQRASSRKVIRNYRIHGVEVGGIYHHVFNADRFPVMQIGLLQGFFAQSPQRDTANRRVALVRRFCPVQLHISIRRRERIALASVCLVYSAGIVGK